MSLRNQSTSALLAVGTLLAAGALTACTITTSNGASKSDVEEQSLASLQSQNPDLQIESVTCSGGLEAKVGAATDCELVGSAGKFTLSATVSDVTDGKVNWTFSDLQPAD